MSPELIHGVEFAVTLIAVLFAIAAVVSVVYNVYVYRQRHEQALFLDRMIVRDIRVGIAAAVILSYLSLAVAGFGLGRPWGAIIIGVPVIVMLFGPTSNALLFRRERRRRRVVP